MSTGDQSRFDSPLPENGFVHYKGIYMSLIHEVHILLLIISVTLFSQYKNKCKKKAIASLVRGLLIFF